MQLMSFMWYKHDTNVILSSSQLVCRLNRFLMWLPRSDFARKLRISQLDSQARRNYVTARGLVFGITTR
jgi:hypothetical protein